MQSFQFLFVLAVFFQLNYRFVKTVTYEESRQIALRIEDNFLLGGTEKLSPREQLVDDCFMQAKLDELSEGFRDPDKNAGGMHFFKAKPLIEQSKIFKFLRDMPKGASLHTHATAAVSSEWVLRNLTYWPGLWRCTRDDDLSVLSFRRDPKRHRCTSRYVLVSDERARAKDMAKYDRAMERLFNLYTPVPEVDYPNINVVWTKFQNMFTTLGDVLKYLPAYRAYIRQLLQELYEDKIMYTELRVGLNELYINDDIEYPTEISIRELLNIAQQFQREHPDFLGVKIIINVQRGVDTNTLRGWLKDYKRLKQIYPKSIVGFDLVGQEDKGKPLYQFVQVLRNQSEPVNYVLHAGETNWYGASTDINLLDAILLNTTRIGHAYALLKHPFLLQTVKRRSIGIELNPVSNQVLNLVWDMRNHPGAFYISQDYPVVICNDDPGFWNARALTYDFYYAIMALAPNHAGLRTLKKLVWNSVKYSILTPAERKVALEQLNKKWNFFIEDNLRNTNTNLIE